MLRSTLRKMTVAFALIGMVGTAQAAFHDLGTITSTNPLNFSLSGLSGSFDDTFSFTFGTPVASGILATFSATGLYGDITVDPSYSQSFGSYTTPYTHLFSFVSASGETTHTGSLIYDQATHAYSQSGILPLGWFPGMTINVNLHGNLGTSQNAAFSLALAPVPEPEAFALMLAGLGLMGTIARRRRKN